MGTSDRHGSDTAEPAGYESLTLTDHLAIYFLELPKLPGDAAPGTGHTDISTTLQHWLYYMHERGEVDAMEDPDIEDAEERCLQFVADDELREKYQDRIKAERNRGHK